MGTSDWIAVGICIALLPAWAAIIGSVWHDRRPDLRAEPPEAWPFGGAVWRAGIRMIPAAGPTIFCAVPVMVLEGSEPGGALAVVAAVAFGGPAVVGLLLMTSIAFFNSPKLLVAPHLRSQPGLLDEWFRNERGARSRPSDEPPQL
jgi:hypothetical protein